jgi:hypothetical protein
VVDSLCIVQDWPQDWENESSRMATIYMHATLTLAAANASSGAEGFLRPTPPPKRTVTMPYFTQEDTLASHYYLSDQLSSFNEDVIGGPLQRRGWTLQERLLSRRVVFFGKIKYTGSARLHLGTKGKHFLNLISILGRQLASGLD